MIVSIDDVLDSQTGLLLCVEGLLLASDVGGEIIAACVGLDPLR